MGLGKEAERFPRKAPSRNDFPSLLSGPNSGRIAVVDTVVVAAAVVAAVVAAGDGG